MAHLFNLPNIELKGIDPWPHPAVQQRPQRLASRCLNTHPGSLGKYANKVADPAQQRATEEIACLVQQASQRNRRQTQEEKKLQTPVSKKVGKPPEQIMEYLTAPPLTENRGAAEASVKDQPKKLSAAERAEETSKEMEEEHFVRGRQLHPVSTEALIKRMEEVEWEVEVGKTPPFVGFNEDAPKDKSILDKIECDSAILFKILNESVIGLGDTIQIVAGLSSVVSVARGGAIRIPENMLEVLAGATLQLQVTKVPGVDKTILELFEELRKPFETGWKRELIYNCVSDARAERVQYVSPDGTELKNMEDLIDYLENIYGISDAEGVGLTAKNFAFCRVSLTLFEQNGGELLYINDPRTGGKRLVKVRRRPQLKFRKSRKPSSETAAGVATGQLVNRKRTMEESPGPLAGIHNIQVRAAVANPQVLSPSPRKQQSVSKGQVLVENEDPFFRSLPSLLMNSSASRSKQPFRGLNKREENGGMFPRLALHEANPTLWNLVEQDNYQAEQTSHPQPPQPGRRNSHSSRRKVELFPCSIRCAGTDGEVPDLQCTRCLCLYHASCIGLPANFSWTDFLCENCVSPVIAGALEQLLLESPAARKAPGLRASSSTRTRNRPLVERGSMRSQIPSSMLAAAGPRQIGVGPTTISTEFQPIGHGGMSIKLMDIRPTDLGLALAQQIKVGRGPVAGLRGKLAQPAVAVGGQLPSRKQKQAYPQLPTLTSGGKSVTITPLPSLGKGGGRPSIPNLRAISNNSNPSFSMPLVSPRLNFNLPTMPLIRGGLARGAVNARRIPIPNLIESGKKHAAKDKNILQRESSLAHAEELFEKSISDCLLFRRYPTSVVTIGKKRYIAIPAPIVQREEKKNEDPDSDAGISPQLAEPEAEIENLPKSGAKLSEREVEVSGSCISPSRNESVLEKIFQYLSVPDLLRASCVNSTWNKVATRKELWQTVRMKNAQVYEFEGFVKFLNKHETEAIDLRKMLNENGTNWELLFESLGKVSSLKSIVLDSRSASPEHLELLSQYCPHIQISHTDLRI